MTRALLFLCATTASLFAAQWDPTAAARYLDSRQQEWFAWKTAQTPDGTCVSCHTGMPYLLARPALRKRLNENSPTEWETKLLTRLARKAGDERKANIQGPQVIFGALLIPPQTPDSDAAHKQLTTLQLQEGDLAGIWQWYDAKLDPWESAGAFSWGSALATRALGANYPNGYETPAAIKWLREHRDAAPLHSRLAMLWAANTLPGLFTPAERKSLIAEVISKQSPDGSWKMDTLGPFMAHPDAPPQPEGGHPYATGYIAWILRETSPKESAQALDKARQWLMSHQNRDTGAWSAPSMNKVYPADSMMAKFMTDAATSFAVLALTD